MTRALITPRDTSRLMLSQHAHLSSLTLSLLSAAVLSAQLSCSALHTPSRALMSKERKERTERTEPQLNVAPPTPLSERLLSLGERRAACLLPLILALAPRPLNEQLQEAQQHEQGALSPTQCRSLLAERDPQLPSAYALWGREQLSVGGTWGQTTEATHTLSVMLWGASAPLDERWGTLKRSTWAQWGREGVERGTRAPHEPLPLHALSLLELERPPKPSAERGGWWAHLALWLPVAHLGYELSLTHPSGWPIGHFGPHPFKERQHASLKNVTWWVPPSLAQQGRALYLSLTPTWASLTRWAWSRLVTPLLTLPPDERLTEGVERAIRGAEALSAWVSERVRYQYSPLRRYEPLSPLQTLKRGAGDCKDMSALAYVLLKYANQPSWFALTSQRPLLRSAREVPSMGWFDHVLLWRPSVEERQRVEGLLKARADQTAPLISSPIASWLDLTRHRGDAQALRGRWAYVLLSERRGVWLQIGGLSAASRAPR